MHIRPGDKIQMLPAEFCLFGDIHSPEEALPELDWTVHRVTGVWPDGDRFYFPWLTVDDWPDELCLGCARKIEKSSLTLEQMIGKELEHL